MSKKDQLLKELADISKTISLHEGISSIPEIERDIILSQLQKIYRTIKLGNSDNRNNEIQSQNEVIEDKKSPIVDFKINESINNRNDVLLEMDDSENNENTSIDKPIIDIESQTVNNTSNTSTEKKVADLFAKKEPLINEVMAEKLRKKDLKSVIESRPIEKLEEVIDLNARFLFIRELFFNNTQLYEKTIQTIDSFRNFNEAFNYIQQQFIWNYESETVQMFLELVRRRFIKDED
jgi:hypothetical protein